MQILGITGGIATGKSTVTGMLAALGAPTLSADALAHAYLAPGTDTARAVLQAFPQSADPQDPQRLTVDRRALGRLIFADPDARRRLESLTHPPIIAALAAQAASWRIQATACAGALEIPLLFETDLRYLVDRVVVVACREEAQIARLCARLGIDESEAKRRINAQWPLAAKIAQADAVITTDDSLEDTRRQVQALWNALPSGRTQTRCAVYTIGHSTHSAGEFVKMLQAYGIETVADVRKISKSRHNPQFGEEELRERLRECDIGYIRLEGLGGLRRSTKASVNTAWKNLSFRGYADYMQTPEFQESLELLIKIAAEKQTAIMCAEAVPWRCHRSLIGDALLIRNIPVVDIMTEKTSRPHILTPFAQVNGDTITYPGTVV